MNGERNNMMLFLLSFPPLSLPCPFAYFVLPTSSLFVSAVRLYFLALSLLAIDAVLLYPIHSTPSILCLTPPTTNRPHLQNIQQATSNMHQINQLWRFYV
mmetsp:Transcript_34086/g.87925  ORF Transcript_34086/g.87925 Transcript_34086/m.87925 type:complete len:100 (+) Transcript_34086:1241-1540(+)